jgi:multidrug resistance efflux pump
VKRVLGIFLLLVVIAAAGGGAWWWWRDRQITEFARTPAGAPTSWPSPAW